MQNAPSFFPIPSQTEVISWQLQYPGAYTQISTRGSWTSRNCSIGNTSSTRSSECSTRNCSTCFVNKDDFLGVTPRYDAAARQEIMKRTPTTVQTQVRQLEHEADDRCSPEANQALEDQRKHSVTAVTSEVWRRDEQLYDLRTELSPHAPHAEDVSQQQDQECAGLHPHLAGDWFRTTQQCREMFEGSRTAQSAVGPDIERFRRSEEEHLREVRRHNNDRNNLRLHKGVGQTSNPTNPGHQKANKSFANYAAKLCYCKHQLGDSVIKT